MDGELAMLAAAIQAYIRIRRLAGRPIKGKEARALISVNRTSKKHAAAIGPRRARLYKRRLRKTRQYFTRYVQPARRRSGLS